MCVSKYLRDACVMLKPLYMKYESAHITSFKPNIPVVYTVLSSLPVVDPVFPLCILSSMFPLRVLYSAHYLLQILLKLAAFRMRFLVNPWQVSAAWLVLQNQINRLVFCVCGPDSNYHLAI